jgi:hypothetical protein
MRFNLAKLAEIPALHARNVRRARRPDELENLGGVNPHDVCALSALSFRCAGKAIPGVAPERDAIAGPI